MQLGVWSKEVGEHSKIDRLHSLSIEKESDFQTLLKTNKPDQRVEDTINLGLFSRVDPLVHGEQNQQRIKAKRSSSIESIVPNIMVDIANLADTKDHDFKVSRLRSFGSIEESYEFDRDRDNKNSEIEQQLDSKEDSDYWLRNIQ